MKTKRIKRCVAFLMMCTMLFAFSATTFAAESDNFVETGMESLQQSTTDAVMPMSDQSVTIPAYGTVKLYFDNSNGFGWKLHVSTSCSTNQGAVIVNVWHSQFPENELSRDWVMGTNDEAIWSVNAIQNGRYVVQISNHCPQSINVRAWDTRF